MLGAPQPTAIDAPKLRGRRGYDETPAAPSGPTLSIWDGKLLKTERAKAGVGRKEMKPPTSRVELLSKELVVAREIYAATRVEKGGPVYFNLLVNRLQTKKLASRATVSKALDMLFDQGIVRADWGVNLEGKHVRALRIAGEAENFVRAIYNHTT